MTEAGKRLTPAHADLTEGATAHGPSEGTERCVLGTHLWECSCASAHQRAWQEDDRDYPVDGWYPGIETSRTWTRCRCLSCCHKALNWVHHRQVDTGIDFTRSIHYAEQRLERAQAHADQVARYLEERRRRALHKQNAENAKSKAGPWEFTLTYSPSKHGWSRDEAKDSMRTAIERLTRYYREEIEEFHAVGELTSTGNPHVHAWYRLTNGRRITTKSFKRAYPVWNEKAKLGRGHEGGHHEPVKRTADFAGYIEKDLDTAWLIIDITNADDQEARVQEAEDDQDDAASPGSASPTDAPAQPHDGELR